jgi:hypothetical protein
MSDDTIRPRRRAIPTDDFDTQQPQEDGSPLDHVRSVQEAVARETGREPTAMTQDSPIQISGSVPPAFQRALQQKGGQQPILESPQNFEQFRDAAKGPAPRRQPKFAEAPTGPTPDRQVRMQGSDELEGLLQRLASQHQWEEFEFCSRGKFYKSVPPVVHIRPMTGEEEQILATPRFVKKGRAIDMIFQRCIREPINTEELLSIDRTHLLIYLRGISYTPEYDVEIKCPECSTKFSTVINLDSMDVNACPDTFDETRLSGVLPTSGFKYKYRLATGGDELEVTNYRERRIQMFGDQSEDDTLLFRTAMLLEYIENVTDRRELQVLMKKLPINDVSYLRNEINDPPFGVKTEIPMVCPSCTAEFDIDLPLEANFFFPKKKEKTLA